MTINMQEFWPWVVVQIITVGVLWLRNNAIIAKERAETRNALAKQEAETQRQINEAALIREQAHRDEQRARADIETQLIQSNNRFADEIRASRETSTGVWTRITDVLDKIARRQEASAATHDRNRERIEALAVQIKTGFDRIDLVQGEQSTLLNAEHGHIDAAAERVMAAVNDVSEDIVTRLAKLDPMVATVDAIAGEVSEIMNNVTALRNAYQATFPQIAAAMTANKSEAVTLASRVDETLALMQRIGDQVTTTEASAIRIAEHIQAIQREQALRLDEPATDADDTAQLPPLPSTSGGDVGA